MEATQATSDLSQVVSTYWGYDSFRPLQREAMESVLDGRDSLVVLPTGGGKSLCYQAPAMLTPGMAVVVSPLISLMKDQVDALAACGVPAAAVNSTLTPGERREVADRVRAGEVKLLYVAPERLVSPRMLEFLQSVPVSLFAIDEAHCISAWGHDFRPEYRGLSVIRETFPNATVHAYTATASAQVRGDIVSQLGLREANVLVGNFDRPNLVYRVRQGRKARFDQVVEALNRHRGESGIVYCISRREVDATAQALNALGHRAAAYHAGLDDGERHRAQDAFLADEVDVIVATVAFGMGIDKPDVRFVIHAGLPKSLEAYQQESGRAGRDGLEAECLLLYSPGDVSTWRRLLASGDTNPEALRGAVQSLQGMAGFATTAVCRHRALVEYFGQQYDRDNCGACDVCLQEVELIDNALVVAQKILSCVVRLDHGYGGDYTSKVLTGSREARILDQRHNELSTYGLLADDHVSAVRSWIEQLVGQGYLQKAGEYDLLQLTPLGAEILKGNGLPKLTRPTKQTTKTSRAAEQSWEGVDRELFEHLRELRKQVAGEEHVPAYVVFGDATLREFARVRPASLEAMSTVRGVGQKKLERYGQLFMDAIVGYANENGLAVDVGVVSEEPEAEMRIDKGLSRGASSALPHFKAGRSVAETAAEIGRARNTVVGYLNEYLRYESVIDPSPWVDESTTRLIEEAIDHCGGKGLKPLYEHLGGEVEYDAIRIVATCVANRG